ncbi:MAG: hypothetical protein HY690_01180 [Chloroflexi bacterium]|nr:hypothetical protein [Chloroflexota bacterium]
MGDEDRERLERQTARNLEGLELERAGRVDEAVRLYEQNLQEGFAGDWPVARLVGIYTARGQLQEAARVLERGIEVLQHSRARTAADRRALLQVYRRRLKALKLKRNA